MALSEIQKKCALLQIEQPELTQIQLAEELGVHRNTIGNWNRNKEFIEFKNDIAMDIHKSFMADTLKVLRDKTLSPNVRSHVKYLELALKTYGVLTDKVESNVTVKDERSEKELLEMLDLDE